MITLLPLGVVCALLVTLDQWVKRWAVLHLQDGAMRDVIPGALGLVYVENPGAAFGLMAGGRWFFVALTLAVVALILVYYCRLPNTRRYWAVRVPVMFILSGAVGNFIDRFRYGYVVDMFAFRFIDFPVFNVADMCLVAGTFSLIFVTLLVVKEKPRRG